ncbi:hypothetical protein MARINOS108_120046 [Marinoscillum sp. 108]|nr:hypothetical protein MARINOS108_120046 [Marinoscillum sp. 108]
MAWESLYLEWSKRSVASYGYVGVFISGLIPRVFGGYKIRKAELISYEDNQAGR